MAKIQTGFNYRHMLLITQKIFLKEILFYLKRFLLNNLLNCIYHIYCFKILFSYKKVNDLQIAVRFQLFYK